MSDSMRLTGAEARLEDERKAANGFTEEHLRVGDVIRVPGFYSTERPARLTLIEDSAPTIGPFCIRFLEAIRLFPQYYKKMAGFEGTFWAVERDGVEIAPCLGVWGQPSKESEK